MGVAAGIGVRRNQEVQSLVFPRAIFTRAQAEGWASFHGFDHGVASVIGDHVVVVHRPLDAFERSTVRLVDLDDPHGIAAVVGRLSRAAEPASASISYLKSRADRERYERYGRRLRRRALARAGARRSGPNDELVTWYLRWFERTHPRFSVHESRVATAIASQLGAAPRDHALDYLRKLGFSGA